MFELFNYHCKHFVCVFFQCDCHPWPPDACPGGDELQTTVDRIRCVRRSWQVPQFNPQQCNFMTRALHVILKSDSSSIFFLQVVWDGVSSAAARNSPSSSRIATNSPLFCNSPQTSRRLLQSWTPRPDTRPSRRRHQTQRKPQGLQNVVTLHLKFWLVISVFVCIFQMSFVHCRLEDKTALLLHLLHDVIDGSQQTVVFVATKYHVEYLSLVRTTKNTVSHSVMCLAWTDSL